MEKAICVDITDKKTRVVFQKSVERLVKRNKKVFDKLAKS